MLACVMLVAQPIFSGTTGKISGRVTSKDTGEPLIGANVMVDGTPLGAATDTEGNYYILQVPPGSYDVKFTMIGYRTLIMNDVRIRVDLTTTLDGQLEEGTVGLDEVVRHQVEVDGLRLEAALRDEVVELGHLHLHRVLRRVRAEQRAAVREEDERELAKVLLQHALARLALNHVKGTQHL